MAEEGSTYSFQNDLSSPMLLWLEPWAEEFTIPPQTRLDLVVAGDRAELRQAEFEFSDTHLVFYAPAGSLVRVIIGGEEQRSGSSEIAVPVTEGFSTRGLMQTMFGAFPEAHLGGAGLRKSEESDRLGAAMANGAVRLEPLAEEHRAALKAACAEDLEIWPIYATSFDPEHFDDSFDLIMSLKKWRRFALFSGDRLVGISCYIGIDDQRGALEIGNTYYVPDMRGTGFNRIVKDLMIRRAVDCGFRRIEFKVDSRNARSQAAMAKLGAVREGVIRADRITWTGHVRDTVLFSILAEEWNG